MNRLKEDCKKTVQFNNIHYEHTILVSKFFFSKVQLFFLTVLTSFTYFEYYRNDIIISERVKIVGILLYIFIFISLFERIFWGVTKESIFIVRSLGLQTTTVYHSHFESTKFIPWSTINDVIINEAIVMQKVIFYLAVLVQSDDKSSGESIIPIFYNAQPRLKELKEIYKNVQLILNK